MEKSQWYIGSPSGVVLCVDHRGEYRFTGRLYHAYSMEALKIVSVEQMLFELDRFYDSINFPHPTTSSRIFEGEIQNTNRNGKREKTMSDIELLSKHGELGTFIIRVQHRQNSSWQGRITWMDRDKTLYFRSVWEMVKLIENALDTVSAPEDNAGELSWPGK